MLKRIAPSMKSLAALTLAALPAVPLATAAGGCHQSDAPIYARGEQYDRPWLMMGSPDLRNSTVVGQPQRYYDESNLLHVTVPVRNTTDKQLYVDYRFTFYDRNGATLNEINGTHTIPPHGAVDFTGNSTSPRAEGDRAFRLELRYPRVN
jgi:uncharacterized protein YcfL